jgi:phenylalanyl-tRNA synthetase alpha chain
LPISISRSPEGPDIESDDYNFTRLNIPAEHPARQMHDTFYMKPQADGSRPLLRTHTSPVQVRTMLSQKAAHSRHRAGAVPIAAIRMRRIRRCSIRSKALVIDEETHLGHLKWVLEEFCKAFFEVPQGEDAVCARPISLHRTVDGGGHPMRPLGGQIRFGEGKDWLEIAGSGMVHPRVLEMCGIDSQALSGLRLRLRHRPPRHAEIWHSGSCARSSNPICAGSNIYGFAALDIPAAA